MSFIHIGGSQTHAKLGSRSEPDHSNVQVAPSARSRISVKLRKAEIFVGGLYLRLYQRGQTGKDLADGRTCWSRRRFHLEFGKAVAELEEDRGLGFGVFGTVGMHFHVPNDYTKEFNRLQCAVGRTIHSSNPGVHDGGK